MLSLLEIGVAEDIEKLPRVELESDGLLVANVDFDDKDLEGPMRKRRLIRALEELGEEYFFEDHGLQSLPGQRCIPQDDPGKMVVSPAEEMKKLEPSFYAAMEIVLDAQGSDAELEDDRLDERKERSVEVVDVEGEGRAVGKVEGVRFESDRGRCRPTQN